MKQLAIYLLLCFSITACASDNLTPPKKDTSEIWFNKKVKHHLVIPKNHEERSYRLFIQPEENIDSPFDYEKLEKITKGHLNEMGFYEAEDGEIPRYKIVITAYESISTHTVVKSQDEYFPADKGLMFGSIGSGEDFTADVYWDHPHQYGEFYGHDSDGISVEGHFKFSKEKSDEFFARTNKRSVMTGHSVPPTVDLSQEKMFMKFFGSDEAGRSMKGFIETRMIRQTNTNKTGKADQTYQNLSVDVYPFYAQIGSSKNRLYQGNIYHIGELKNHNEYVRSMLGTFFDQFPGPTQTCDRYLWHDRRKFLQHEFDVD